MRRTMGGVGAGRDAGAAASAQTSAENYEGETFLLNGETEITVRAPAPEHLDGALPEVISGWVFRNPETRELEMDDFDNPAMLHVDRERAIWAAETGSDGKSCASCHDEPESLHGVRPVYPKWDGERGEVQTLEMQVNECVTERMGAEAWNWDGDDMKDMTALIASVSRGMPVDVTIDGPAQSTWERGREIYYTRTDSWSSPAPTATKTTGTT